MIRLEGTTKMIEYLCATALRLARDSHAVSVNGGLTDLRQ